MTGDMQKSCWTKIQQFFDSSKSPKHSVDDECVTFVFDIRPQCRQLEVEMGPLFVAASTSNSTDD